MACVCGYDTRKLSAASYEDRSRCCAHALGCLPRVMARYLLLSAACHLCCQIFLQPQTAAGCLLVASSRWYVHSTYDLMVARAGVFKSCQGCKLTLTRSLWQRQA